MSGQKSSRCLDFLNQIFFVLQILSPDEIEKYVAEIEKEKEENEKKKQKKTS